MANRYQKQWTEERIAEGIMEIAATFESQRMPSNREVIEYMGDYALAVAIQKNGGYKYWADKLGLEQKYSDTKLGVEGEHYIAEKLRNRGYEVELTSVKYPYDLLINGCVKIDVKTANTSYVRGCPIHSYRLAKGQPTCDFYILLEMDTKNVYVVPSCKVVGQVQIGMGQHSKPYQMYFAAFDLIKEVVDMYHRM